MLAGGWGKPAGRIWHYTCWHKLMSRPSVCPLSFLFAHFNKWSSWLGSWLRLQFCLWKQSSGLTLWKNAGCPKNRPNSWSLHFLDVSSCPLYPLQWCDFVSQWAQFCSEPDTSCSALQTDNPAIHLLSITHRSAISFGHLLEIQNLNAHPDLLWYVDKYMSMS